ncbi:hypothetical protein C8Q73DRAFT_310196 [Cubamyces lactineus]|nr:hypothetical protein C8Q73DRAFT_310196 [Cubamyces lactineus]
MFHRGIEVWIAYSDGKRIPEFEVQVDAEDERKMTCTIPSDVGRMFMVCWQYHSGEHRVGISTRVDGVRVGSNACSPGQKGRRVGVRTVSADTYQMFQFATVFTMDTEDGAFLGACSTTHRRAGKLGTIQLRMHHVQPVLGPSLPFQPHPVNLGGIVASSAPDDAKDKLEKFSSFDRHCVKLGKGLKRGKAQVDIPQASALDKSAGPFATFVFRYRPTAVLQAEGIMPMSEAKSLADEDSSDDDEEEYDEVENANGRSRFAKYSFATIAKACLRRAKRASTIRQSWSSNERDS